MTPEVKKIGNKLFDKVELSSVKVELSVSTDIEKYIDNSIERFTNANEMIKKAIVEYGIASNGYKQAIILSENAIKTTKDLGLDSKFFEGRLSIAKDWLAKSEKNKNITIQF